MPSQKSTVLPQLSLEAIAAEAVGPRHAMQKEQELARLLNLVRHHQVRDVLEIGGMHGGTTWAWSQVASGELVCIDLFVLEGRMESAAGLDYTFIEGDSHAYSTRKKLGNRRFDFLFIDGDHSYPGVRRDFELYAPLVRPGGLIALHDVCVEQPIRVRGEHDVVPYWNQIRALYKHREIYDAAGGVWGGIGVLYVPSIPELAPQALRAAAILPGASDTHRRARVPCVELCDRCGQQLVPPEDTVCRGCAASG